MGFVGNYALYGLAPQMQNMPVIQEKKRPATAGRFFLQGAECEVRTRDLRLGKPPLYQLS